MNIPKAHKIWIAAGYWPERCEMMQVWADYFYGLGGIVLPFIGIKAIDLAVTALHLV
jgi:high-affinity K+ transport system ATPase subunit B